MYCISLVWNEWESAALLDTVLFATNIQQWENLFYYTCALAQSMSAICPLKIVLSPMQQGNE